MRIEWNGNNILHGDFNSPPMCVAQFVDNLLDSPKREFIIEHNLGAEVLSIIKQYGGMPRSIEDVSKVLDKIENVYYKEIQNNE